ncbi:PAS domain S-box protein [Leptospira ognonensis]|uniref:PAS domain S-box protein n=1 Tax=Leptospira ognonensis TaxID=2484945 RepID=A0A4R9JWK0_9LEPT|nr:CheR family methyltransferase [Leptospira ognonensis]TGL56721.1 PAS domain S-box protein [Leptospira ognonensis]
MKKAESFAIVGIGASAGGLAAFEAFFAGMPTDKDPNMAFVLVQHLAPDHKSILADLVRRYTRMEVFEVEDGMVLKPNCAYIKPPNTNLSFQQGHLKLSEPSTLRGQRMTIDFFFKTLAEDLRERAIGIVLSGTGFDGTLGARAIKAEGGMVMAQLPESTEYESMPRSVIDSVLVDFVLTPAEMPAQLIRYAEHSLGKLPKKEFISSVSTDTLQRIFTLLRTQSGHDFSQYKPSTILRRIERRIAIHQLMTIDEYVAFASQTPTEVDALFRDVLIGVTNFFRDPDAFAEIEEKIIPQLCDKKTADASLRIWVPACSTGEEAYTIAILISEEMEKRKIHFPVQLFATDIDPKAIATARAGVYPETIAEDITPERLARFFVRESVGNTYRVHKGIRDMLVFSEQDLTRDPPFSKLDLISCRNLLIYLSSDLQKRIIILFHYALNPKGYLFLGNSESVGDNYHLFTSLNRMLRIFQKKEDIISFQRSFSARIIPPGNDLIPSPSKGRVKFPLRDIAEQALLKQFAPAAALVDDKGNILYLHGRTGMFFEPAPGETIAPNIMKMAREGLRRDLSLSFHKAVTSRKQIECKELQVKTNGSYSTINLTISPLGDSDHANTEVPLFLVVLEIISAEGIVAIPSADKSTESAMILSLQKELQSNQEYLQSTLEELETANEELKFSNEEMQSVNEEMQSTNEELETSKEELQSVNEELATVNHELQSKVTDLSRVNNDMNNLLSGTGIATIFVDYSLRILRFTPMATKIINLIESDIDRPVNHILSNLKNYETLTSDIQAVLDTLVHKELEVQTTAGIWYSMRILPYRTLNNVIEGAVLTFVDINEVKRLQALREAVLTTLQNRERDLKESQRIAHVGSWHINMITNEVDWSVELYRIYEIDSSLPPLPFVEQMNLYSLASRESFASAITILQEKGTPYSLELQSERKDGSVRWMFVKGEAEYDMIGKMIGLWGAVQDITKQKQVEEEITKQLTEKEILLKEVHHRIKNNLASVEGLLTLQSEETEIEEVKLALRESISRIQSIRLLYEKLLAGRDYQDIAIKDYLNSLLDSILLVFAGGKTVSIERRIDDFSLNSKKAITLGIIVNELITNIFNHAFTEKDHGNIRIDLVKDENRITFSIKDDGTGIVPKEVPSKSTGFGQLVIKMLAEQLKGTFRVENDFGTRSILKFEI